MKLITWNIQWGLGVDGRVDLPRIVSTARQMADFDVLCLQEVSRNFPGLRANNGADQFAELAALVPGFHAIEGVAVDQYADGLGRRQFGNMILTRFEPLQILRHLLPWPADPTAPTMPRLALEAVLATPTGPLRVTTTHLEFYSAPQRKAQVEALRRIQEDAASHHQDVVQPQKHGGPFETRPRNARGILTGDFNCDPADPAIKRLLEPFEGGVAGLTDAWTLAHPGAAHASTVGVHDKEQWQGRVPCFDFIFVTDDLRERVRRVDVNLDTAASDHQPVLIELDL